MTETEDRQLDPVPRIFISHSSEDDTFGKRLVKDLRNAFRDEDAVWYDRMGTTPGGGLIPGASWWQTIVQQITARYFFLLIMSPDAFASNWVKAELEIASRQRIDNNNNRTCIIPLYYRTCDIPADIDGIQFVDFRGCDNPSKPNIYLDALDKLLRTLQDSGMHIGMEGVSGKTSDNVSPQEEPQPIIRVLTSSVRDAFRLGNWSKVLDDAQDLIKRATGAVPSEVYEMRGLAALHEGLAALHQGESRLAEEELQIAEDALQTFLAQQGDMEQRLALLLKYIQLVNAQNQSDLVRKYTYMLMDIIRDDPYWFTTMLHHLARLIPSDIRIVSDADLPPSYISHAHTYEGHTKEVYAVAWSPDNKYIASAGKDHTLRIWEPNTRRGDAIACCQHAQAVRCVAWRSPQPADGLWRFLATACDDHTVYIWGIGPQDGKQILLNRLSGHRSSVRSVSWSPDGKFLASGSDDGTVRIWGLPTLDKPDQKSIRIFEHADWVNAVAWSPHQEDNEYNYLASASSDKTVKVWHTSTGSCICTYRGHQKAVYDLIWSPNGATLASASGDKTVQIWEYNTGNRGTTYRQHNDIVVSLARSPYGRRIVSSSKNSLHLWYAATGDTILSNSLNVGWIRKIAWSPDGLSIALTTGEQHTVQVWHVTSAVLGLI